MITIVADWLQSHPLLAGIAIGFSIATILASMVLVPVLVGRMPTDYLLRHRSESAPRRKTHPVLHASILIGRNVLGTVLLLAGLLMLVMPGQGVLTILAGLALTDLPGKHRLVQWIVSRPRVKAAINTWRARYGQAPLKMPTR